MSETINFSKRKTLETEISFHQTAITTIFVISEESDKREMKKKTESRCKLFKLSLRLSINKNGHLIRT
jgi:hypothetical protein